MSLIEDAHGLKKKDHIYNWSARSRWPLISVYVRSLVRNGSVDLTWLSKILIFFVTGACLTSALFCHWTYIAYSEKNKLELVSLACFPKAKNDSLLKSFIFRECIHWQLILQNYSHGISLFKFHHSLKLHAFDWEFLNDLIAALLNIVLISFQINVGCWLCINYWHCVYIYLLFWINNFYWLLFDFNHHPGIVFIYNCCSD